MKREFLENLKIGDQALSKDLIDTIMAENGRDIESAKKPFADYEAIKEQLKTAQDGLKAFEGVDVKDLQGQITKLQGDLKAKEDEYAAKEAERVFTDSVKTAIKAAGGRNEKAVIAMLDMESLKGSKNQSEDIKKALEDVKKSDGYLFGANEPINNQVGSLGGGSGTDADSMVSLRAAMGLPEKN